MEALCIQNFFINNVEILYVRCMCAHKKGRSMHKSIIIIQPLLKAFNKFENFRHHLNSEQEKAGAIQAFEYCFELT